MLTHYVDDPVFGGDIDGSGIFERVLNVLFHDFTVMGGDRMKAAIVKTVNVRAADAEKNAANFDVGGLFGFNNGVADVFNREIEIDDFPFADPARLCLAEANNAKAAGVIQLGDDSADF
jgi:hypothetical protein